MARLNDRDILLRLNSAAENAGVNLTYVHKLFFVRLLGIADSDDKGCYTTLSVDDLAAAVDLPLRTVTKSLNLLTACGALSLEARSRPQFRRINMSIIDEGY